MRCPQDPSNPGTPVKNGGGAESPTGAPASPGQANEAEPKASPGLGIRKSTSIPSFLQKARNAQSGSGTNLQAAASGASSMAGGSTNELRQVRASTHTHTHTE